MGCGLYLRPMLSKNEIFDDAESHIALRFVLSVRYAVPLRTYIVRNRGAQPESESLIRRRLRLRALSVSSGLLCNFVAVYLTFVQFVLQLKLCLYTVMHLLLEVF